MKAPPTRDALHRIAARCGVQIVHHGDDGAPHTASDDTLIAVLEALGGADGMEEVAGRFAELDARASPSDGPTPALAPPTGRRFGVFAPVYALRRDRDRGVGTLGHLGELAAWAGGHGASVVAVLPLLATWPEDASPYAPLSRQAWSESVLDLDALPALVARPTLRAHLPPETASDRLVALPETTHAIEAAVDAVAAGVADLPGVRKRVDAFAARRPDLVRYAEFRALAERHGRDWRCWPAEARRGGEAVAADRRFRYLYGQYSVDAQLGALAEAMSARGQVLALDLPVGANPGGFDTWAAPDEFVLGVSVGAPPDDFAPEGQNWGLPPVHPGRAGGDGPVGFVAALRHHLEYSRMLRIDHVMGLHRLWWIPEGFPAADGVYVHLPSSSLYDVVVREAIAHDAMLVGEDLGTVEPVVRDTMRERGVLGMWELQFAVHDPPEAPLAVPQRPTVASCNTHDMAPFAAFWTGADLDERAALALVGDLDAARRERSAQIGVMAHRLGAVLAREAPYGAAAGFDAALEFLASSDAPIVMVALEDLWGEQRAQNVPGTMEPLRANWRQRTALALGSFEVDAVVRRLAIVAAHRGPGVDPGV